MARIYAVVVDTYIILSTHIHAYPSAGYPFQGLDDMWAFHP